MARAKSFFFQGEIREKTFTGKILKETHDHRDAKYKVFHNFNQIKGRETSVEHSLLFLATKNEFEKCSINR